MSQIKCEVCGKYIDNSQDCQIDCDDCSLNHIDCTNTNIICHCNYANLYKIILMEKQNQEYYLLNKIQDLEMIIDHLQNELLLYNEYTKRG